MMKPKFFAKPENFREWLKNNYNKQDELWVGYYKKGSGKPSITWPESVDEALCFGWIDGLRNSIDDISYKIRFTPRRPASHWSRINMEKVKVLIEKGLMQPAGMEAFNQRNEENSTKASYEQKIVVLDPVYQKQIEINKKAWLYYQNLPPSIRKQCIWWIMSAKREETRQKRLGILINSSEEGQRIPPLKWSEKK